MPRASPSYGGYRPASEASSRAKRANPARNTQPELLLRKALWRKGLRYRLAARELPGKPDLVFSKYRLVVFVDGDFWHGRNWERQKQKLARGSNGPYWLAKIAYNIERDRGIDAQLRGLGWRVMRFWEGDIRQDPEIAAAQVVEYVVQEEETRG